MKKIISLFLSVILVFSLVTMSENVVNAKNKKLKVGFYYNSKKKIYMEVWYLSKEPYFSVESRERPGNVLTYGFVYKKGKLVMDYKRYQTKVIVKSKKKFVWKGKRKEGTAFLNGTYKFKKKKGNLLNF